MSSGLQIEGRYSVEMADFRTASSIGGRIAALRKARGFKAAKDLADAVPNETVTESILQNIEAGRQPDLKVSQLVNIAWALQTSPAFLLAPLGAPSAPLDLPNLAGELITLPVGEFDAWLAGSTDGSYQPRSAEERSERFDLETLRELLRERRELARLVVMRNLEAEASEEGVDLDFARESTLGRIGFITSRISELESYLASGGLNVAD